MVLIMHLSLSRLPQYACSTMATTIARNAQSPSPATQAMCRVHSEQLLHNVQYVIVAQWQLISCLVALLQTLLIAARPIRAGMFLLLLCKTWQTTCELHRAGKQTAAKGMLQK